MTSAATLREKVPGLASTIWTACKPLLRCTHSLLLRQMHMRSCGSRRNVQRSNKLQRLVKRMARGVVLAADSGSPVGWRNADIAAIDRSEGAPAVLRDWTGTLDSGNGPTQYGEAT